MAKKSVKKTAKKKTTKKVSKSKVKRAPKKVVKKSVRKTPVKSIKRKILLVLTKLIFFVVLGLASFLLYLFLGNEVLDRLFLLLTIVFGFISVGFLIVLLIFVFLKLLKK